MRVASFLPEVEEDMFAGYLWYEKRAFGLGKEFLRMFYARMLMALRNVCH